MHAKYEEPHEIKIQMSQGKLFHLLTLLLCVASYLLSIPYFRPMHHRQSSHPYYVRLAAKVFPRLSTCVQPQILSRRQLRPLPGHHRARR